MRARALILALLLILAAAPPAFGSSSLWSEVEQARNDPAYADASAWRRAQVRALVADLVRGANAGVLPSSARRRAEAAGLSLEDRGAWVVLRSLPEAADGYYLFRKGSDAGPLVLQAPHAWYDLNTGRIACALFEAGHGRALLLNTAHRKSSPVGNSEGEIGADVAHRPGSVFQAVHLGVADAIQDGLVVQLHGFGPQHGEHAAVVSEGASTPPPGHVSRAIEALEPLLGRYGPITTGEEQPNLAGRSNAQSQALEGQARFLHLELSLEARRGLVSSAELQQQLGTTLTELARRR